MLLRGTPATLMSTELNSLAPGQRLVSSSYFSMESGGLAFEFADLALTAASPGAVQPAEIEIYLLPSIDGGTSNFANFPLYGDPPENLFAAFFELRADQGVEKLVAREVKLPAGYFKVGIINWSDAYLAASGNVLTALPYGTAEDSGSAGAVPSLCNGRLTLTTGVPVTTADVTAAGTLYFTPYLGNQVALYDGSDWAVSAFTERSLAFSTVVKNVNYDVFLYDNSGTLTLELTEWKSVTATNSPTSGSNKVINVPDTTGVAIGDLVTVKDGTNNQVARVTALVANTSITVASLATNFTTPTIYYNSRATDLTTQDGVYVKSGATTRRYLGTIRGSGTNTCEDSNTKRFVWNLNAIPRVSKTNDSTANWSVSGGPAAMNGGNANWKHELVIGVKLYPVRSKATAHVAPNAGGGSTAGIGLDTTTAYADMGWGVYQANSNVLALYEGTMEIGYHYLNALQQSSAGTATFYGGGYACMWTDFVG